MVDKKQLRGKQRQVLDEFFCGELDEQGVLDKYGVSRSVYHRWLCEDIFISELVRRVKSARLQSELLIAQYYLVAAAKLVRLTDSEKPWK